jgi:hypothetical protein
MKCAHAIPRANDDDGYSIMLQANGRFYRNFV